MKRQNLLIIISILFIFLFTYAATSKLLIYDIFAHQLKKQPFDDKFSGVLSVSIPSSELLASVLLLLRPTRIYGLIFSTTLMTMFTGYIMLIEAGYYGRIPCSCGGGIEELSWKQHLFMNIFFLMIGLLGCFLVFKIMQTRDLLHHNNAMSNMTRSCLIEYSR